MKFLTNLHNPNLPNHAMSIIPESNETLEQALKHEQEWLRGKVIGEPEATE